MPKLTKRVVEALEPDEKREILIFDSELKGFGVRVYPSGTRAYLVQYRTKGGRQRRLALGPHGVLTAQQARSLAMQQLAEVHQGGDPAGQLHAERRGPTVSELCDRYLKDHAEGRKRASSVRNDAAMIRRFVRRLLGRHKVSEVTRADVTRLHNSLRKTPYQANRVLALLSKMFDLAERWGLRDEGSNPAHRVERFKERKRERYLSEVELGRLASVLAEVEQSRVELPEVVNAIRILIFTGCRLSEILELQWDYIDFERACIRLPESKTGAKTVPLNAPALQVLSEIGRGDSPWVIQGAKEGCHLVNLNKAWRRIRARAELDDVRLHDLRHSFASFAAGAGIGLHIIGGLLGHTQAATTKRYAHLADDPLREASERVGSRIAAAMSNGPAGELVDLRRNR